MQKKKSLEVNISTQLAEQLAVLFCELTAPLHNKMFILYINKYLKNVTYCSFKYDLLIYVTTVYFYLSVI